MIKAFKKNAETFYDYSTGNKISVLPRYISIFFGSLFLAVIVNGNLKDFSDFAIAILAIFAGFSFAILFFIVSNKSYSKNENSEDESDIDLEKDLKDEKIDDLEKELFHNLSYFNIVCLLACGTLLLNSISALEMIEAHSNKNVASIYAEYGIAFGRFCSFFLVIEALSTFYRIVRRMTSYFEEKLEG